VSAALFEARIHSGTNFVSRGPFVAASTRPANKMKILFYLHIPPAVAFSIVPSLRKHIHESVHFAVSHSPALRDDV